MSSCPIHSILLSLSLTLVLLLRLSVSPSPQARGAGTRFNKERDAESVIEALRKVVDKLKGENDRLRRGVGTGEGKAADTEKRLATERKKTEKLEDEVKICSEPLLYYPLLISPI